MQLLYKKCCVRRSWYAKKSSHMGAFFSFENGLQKILIFEEQPFCFDTHLSTSILLLFFPNHFFKIIYKIVCGVAYGLVSKVYCLWTRGTKKPSHMGVFFLHAKIFGHNSFCTVLHMINMDNFNKFNYKITKKKIINLVFWT